MKVAVDPELCISCGACVSMCPDVYEWGEDDKAIAKDGGSVPSELESEAEEAADSCPTDAIKTA